MILDQKKVEILDELSGCFSYQEVVNYCFHQIDLIKKFDGKILYFIDQEHPDSFKVFSYDFHDQYKKMEDFCKNSELPVKNYRTAYECYQEGKIISIVRDSLDSYDEITKQRMQLWNLKNMIYLPIKKSGNSPIGILVLFHGTDLVPGEINEQMQEMIEIFYCFLKKTLAIDKALANQKEIEIAKAKYRKLLDLVTFFNVLTDPIEIYKKVINEMLLVFGFELGFVQIEKDGRLPIIAGAGIDDDMEKIVEKEIEVFGVFENAHKIFPLMNPEGGACCVCFANNTHFYIYDTQAIANLQMTQKDKTGLELVGMPIKSFVQIPIRSESNVYGILQLWSIHKNIVLKQDDIELISHVLSFIPSVLKNSQLHALVEKQKNELIDKSRMIQEKNREILEDLKLARQIQQKVVSKNVPELPHVKVSSLYKPMEEIGGDFFECIYHKHKDIVSFFISDVSGHGVPAALITTMLKTLLQTAGEEKYSPARLLTYLNEKLYGKTNHNFITAFYGILDLGTNQFKYARASHNFPFLIRDQKLIELESKGKILGISPDLCFEEKILDLKTGDKLLLYTDGLTETINSEKEQFEEKLIEIMLKLSDKPIETFIERIYSELLQFSERYHFDDDVCMIGIQIT